MAPPPPPPGFDFFKRSSSTEPTIGDVQWTRGATGRCARARLCQKPRLAPVGQVWFRPPCRWAP
eukprot:1610037-Lingulodinium_polyedra.AAC.1